MAKPDTVFIEVSIENPFKKGDKLGFFKLYREDDTVKFLIPTAGVVTGAVLLAAAIVKR
jgi:hypothetical protein